MIKRQIEADVESLPNREEIRNECKKIVAEEGLFEKLNSSVQKLSSADKKKLLEKIKNLNIECALSIYASSYNYYAPIVLEWVHSLLETAVASESRLVFVARDASVIYEVAELLKKKYPDKYGIVPLSHVYISRSVIDWAYRTNPKIFRKYLMQQGLKDRESVIFVDIGFNGSRNAKIKEMLKPINTNIEFSYLISHNPDVKGFLADCDNWMESLPRIRSNPVIYWLEDTHQGVIESPKYLLEANNYEIMPDTKAGHDLMESDGPHYPIDVTCRGSNPKDYLYKILGFKAVLDYAQKSIYKTDYLNGKAPKKHRKIENNSREMFGKILNQILRGERQLFVRHYD